MTSSALDTQRADAIYRFGPETLAARAHAIYAGPIARYSKQVTEMSQPGPDGFPLKWVASGRIEQPAVLKGTPPAGGMAPFIRAEQSGMLPQPPQVAAWERELGDLQPGGDVLLFFQGDPVKPSLTVLPAQAGEAGLAARVREFVAIQADLDPARRNAAWLAYLQSTPHDEGRKAALRALLATPAPDWLALHSALQAVLATPPGAGLRTYATGIVAFGVMQETWGTHQADAVDFLCRQFSTTQNVDAALNQLLTLKLVLNHLSDETAAAARRPLQQRVLLCLKQRAAAGPLPPALAQQYEQLRASHPGQL